MNTQTHITTREIVGLEDGSLPPEELRMVDAHTAECAECAGRVASLKAFVRGLDDNWNSARLQAMNVVHPSSALLEDVWMEESGADVEAARRHAAGCASCTEHLKRLEDGFMALQQEDPLAARPSWSAVVVRKFAAGIEMVVEAAEGAYATAGDMVRDVMTPQTTLRLAPTATVSMGDSPTEAHQQTKVWHDVSFSTDEMSGEITGSTDHATGRGIITVLVNKSGEYVAAPPLVDLLAGDGRTVSTQYALDMGDRYSASFANLDQGRYLVGIREPGTSAG